MNAGIPCDVLHLDTYWQPEACGRSSIGTPAPFPDPDSMLGHPARDGLSGLCLDESSISVTLARFAPRPRAGLLAHARPMAASDCATPGTVASPMRHRRLHRPQATNRSKTLLRPLAAQGIGVFKTDFAEGVPIRCRAYNGMSGTDLHNVYAAALNDAVSRGHPGSPRPQHGMGAIVASGRSAARGPMGRRHHV